MKCLNCGYESDPGFQFCGKCGSPLAVNEPKMIHLKCQECKGIMEVDENNMIAFCPYCGSKNLIVESDTVKVEKIRVQGEIEKEKIKQDSIIKEKEAELKQEKQEHKHWVIDGFVLIAIFALMYFLFFR